MSRSDFTTIRTEGALLPPGLLKRLNDGDPGLPGTSGDAYHVPPPRRLTEAISEAWNTLQGTWTAYREARDRLPATDTGTTLTRERWLQPLFLALGYGRLLTHPAITIDGTTYPISHRWHHVPIHLVSFRLDLDRRTPGVAGAARSSPHGLLQAYLNATDDSLWGIVSNGHRLRLLRDHHTLTRQAYLEFDLETMLEGEVYADFVLLYLTLHQSRLEAANPSETVLEQWATLARETGTRALDRLRDGVLRALEALGQGFIDHPRNTTLRERLAGGALTTLDYYRQLLRVVYRLLVLFAAEDRDLLHPPDATSEARARYQHYGTRRLREVADAVAGGPHPDRYDGFRLLTQLLARDGAAALGIPALGGFLFSDRATPDLDAAQLTNRAFLRAVRALAFTTDAGARLPVDYRNLGAEELGSVYESLLELHPRFDGGTFTLQAAAGNERKATGSYYTPTGLTNLLLDTALDPVLDEAAAAPDPERAILDLKIVDPASGSGHFLIAAAHRVARRLAQARTHNDEPAIEETRSALRDVIGHCLYAVDVNPMAAELCRVALWLEALEPGRPLTFLDHRVKTGNSLLCADPRLTVRELVEGGVPDAAYAPLFGDDKAIATGTRAKNAGERGGERGLFGPTPTDQTQALARALQRLDAAHEETVDDVRRKEDAYRDLLRTGAYRHAKSTADAWCAAFFWPMRKDRPRPVTSGDLHHLLDGKPLASDQAAELQRLTTEHAFFQWRLEFPDVFDRPDPGFDVVVGNPPWERLKLQEEEFFATRAPEIANAKNAAARKRMIERLPQADPALGEAWSDAQRRAAAESHFLRNSGRYPLGGVGDVNTYAVFADLFRQFTRASGTASLLLPNGLVTGYTYRGFLRELLTTRTLASFYGFENEDLLFPDITNKNKFGVLTMTGPSRPVERPWFTAHLRQPDQVHEPARRYSLTADEIEAINPNTLTIPTFRWARDAEVTAAIHRAGVPLVRKHEDGREDNPWGVRFRRLFDMANDSQYFIDHALVAPHIVERRGALAVLDDGRELYPLYEGKMLWHFDHRYGTYEGQTQKQANKGVLPHVDDARHADPEFRVQPRYWVEAQRTREALGADAGREWFFAWRDVGPSERTFVGSVIPQTAAGHKAPLLVCELPPADAVALSGLLSTLVVDYSARQRGSGMSFFIVEQLPILAPADLSAVRKWSGDALRDWLNDRVLELTYTSYEMRPVAADLGFAGAPFPWDPARRAVLQAELDAGVLHLYGLTRAHAEWLLDSFTVLRKYEERDHGEFRTRRLVLAAYDAISEAAIEERAFASGLVPAPGWWRRTSGSAVAST